MSEQPDLSRRGLFTGAFLTKDGRKGIERQQQPLGPRPPWHQQVQEQCGRCEQECAASCPQDIIKLHPDTHTHAGTPWLDFSVTGCTFCRECAEACPSIDDYKKDSPYIGDLLFATESCLTWNKVFCMSCLGKCDVSALTLDESRRLVLNNDLCNGCGMCVHTCPVSAMAIGKDNS